MSFVLVFDVGSFGPSSSLWNHTILDRILCSAAIMKNLLRRFSLGGGTNLTKKEPERGNLGKTKSVASVDSTICTFDDDCSSMCCQDDDLRASPLNQRIPLSVTKRRVQFAADCLLYPNPCIYVDDETESEPCSLRQRSECHGKVLVSKRAIWYNRADVATFQSKIKVYVRRLRLREKHQSSPSLISVWSQSLNNAYQALESNIDNVDIVMASASATDPMLVGLEKWLHKESSETRYQQRKALYQTLINAQASGITCPNEIRRLSCEASRPCRLFAAYLARTVLPDQC